MSRLSRAIKAYSETEESGVQRKVLRDEWAEKRQQDDARDSRIIFWGMLVAGVCWAIGVYFSGVAR